MVKTIGFLLGVSIIATYMAGCRTVLGWEESTERHTEDAAAGAAGFDGGEGGRDGSVAGSAGEGGLAGNAGEAGSTGLGGNAGQGGQGSPTVGGPGSSCKDMNGSECNGESCCSNVLVSGGTFLMGRSDGGNDACPNGIKCESQEQPEHSASVASFYLDKYEVTVGRYRRFVVQYDAWKKPSDGAGAHAEIPGSGWKASWNSQLPANKAALVTLLNCDSKYQTWTNAVGVHEQSPINCVSWYEAQAFCIWDGGMLPTEAQWEYAASGGDENRLYPWGSDAPDGTRANYAASDHISVLRVGSKQAGTGRWGHYDLAGSVWEWTLDSFGKVWYAAGGKNCKDCANITNAPCRTLRGGDWDNTATYLRAANRGCGTPTFRDSHAGFRCLRTP